jgi:putative transposase
VYLTEALLRLFIFAKFLLALRMTLAPYFQKLPHFQQPDACYFVTYRLDGAVPKFRIQQLRDEYEFKLKRLQSTKLDARELYLEKKQLQFDYFKLVDEETDKSLNEPYWLKEDAIAEIVANSLHFLAKSKVELWCFCIMPNHVHAVLELMNSEDDLFRIMQQHKSFTGVQANKILNRTGQFWERESYDHIIRHNQFETIIGYSILNPVSAGFVNRYSDWKWTYVHPKIADTFKDT